MRTVDFAPWLTLGILFGCGNTDLPDAKITFTGGQEATTFEGVNAFTVERIDANNQSVQVFSGIELPVSLDAGQSGIYRFRATGTDVNGAVIARGETLWQDVNLMRGSEMPLFLARTDRTTLAPENLSMAPGAHPKAALIAPSILWVWANPTSDGITTDGYSVAYWMHVSPSSSVSTITCPVTPCDWKNLVKIGDYYVIAIAGDWARLVDGYSGNIWQYPVPADLGSFANVTGGRVLTGAAGSAVLIGAARDGDPTAYVVGFTSNAEATVRLLTTPRAQAATLFESEQGLVVVGGSSEGAGVERLVTGGSAFVPLNYPADPVVGAALVVADSTHVLRMGGRNPDGSPADTVSIDLACAADVCATTPVPTIPALGWDSAVSFYDPESGDSMVVGEDADGLSLFVRYDAKNQILTPIQIPSNQARAHATAIPLLSRQVALVGGLIPGDSGSSAFISVVSF